MVKLEPALSFEALYGSHNYKLNRRDSDVDMMYFYNPSFKDLCDGRMAESNIDDKSTDRKHHDVRKIPGLFYKANVNFLEILHSCRVKDNDPLYDLLRSVRDDITSMNIPRLFDGCLGMYDRNYKNFQRDWNYVPLEEFLNHELLIKKVGKHAAAAYRIVDFMERFASQNFTEFGKAIAYEPGINKDKAFIDVFMAMRDGLIGFSEMDDMLKKKESQALELKDYFKEQQVQEEVYQFVLEIIETHVKEQLVMELGCY
jgi:hypothetical protein